MGSAGQYQCLQSGDATIDGQAGSTTGQHTQCRLIVIGDARKVPIDGILLGEFFEELITSRDQPCAAIFTQ